MDWVQFSCKREANVQCFSNTNKNRTMLKLKKETLTVAFPCEIVDQYVYGQHVYMQSEQKPLETNTKKSTIGAAKTLQGMLLEIQHRHCAHERDRNAHRRRIFRVYLLYWKTHWNIELSWNYKRRTWLKIIQPKLIFPPLLTVLWLRELSHHK